MKTRAADAIRAIVPGLALFALSGCVTTPIVTTQVIDGIEITEHIDDQLPRGCEQAFPTGGCYEMRDGKRHIWYSVASMPYVRKHEIAHAKGMRHTFPWSWDGKQSCATVLTGGGGYHQGDEICVDERGEHVARPSQIAAGFRAGR